MRIVFLTRRELAHPLAGGSETLVDRLARGAVERGHEVTVLCATPVEQRAYRVVDIGPDPVQYLTAPYHLLRNHRDADLVVDVSNGMTFLAPLYRRGPSICLVNHIHTQQWGQWYPRVPAAIGRWLEGTAMPLAYRNHLYMAVSPSTADGLVGLGVRPDQIRIVPNGVDARLVSAPKSDEPLFVACGRFVPHKRHDLLLDLWAEVHRSVGGRLVIIGDGPHRERLLQRRAEHVVLPGQISDQERDRLFSQAWALLHPAMHEGWGLVVMEAAAAGTPTIGFDVPGVRDSIAHGRSGIVAPDEAAFVDGWRRIAEDAALRQKLSDGARAWSQEFSWDATVDGFLAMADEAVGAVPSATARRRSADWHPSGLPAVPTRRPAVSIIVPAYNEAARLPSVLPRMAELAARPGVELIVVDDGSTDDTAAVVARGLRGARLLRLPGNAGKGAAVRTGVARARGDQIVFMDADLATDLRDLDPLLAALRTSHVAVGSRATPGSHTEGATLSRTYMGRTFNLAARTVTGLDIRDLQCGFKAFRAPVAKLLFCLSRCDGYAFDVELLTLADRIGYSTVEVPVRWTAVDGSHVRPVRDSTTMAIDVLRARARWREHHVISAISAHNPRRTNPAESVDALRSHIASGDPVVPWRGGALALLPFAERDHVRELASSIQGQVPELLVAPLPLPAPVLLGPEARSLRAALASLT